MKYCGFFKYILLVASFVLGEQVAATEKHHGEIYDAVINETVESHQWNITDFNVSIPHNNSVGIGGLGNCEHNPCMNDGECFDSSGIICFCKEPYQGSRCEINPCDPNPCRNNGQCDPTDSTSKGFRCICPEPYFGDECESILDLCLEHPCMNDGQCETTAKGYKCKCTEHYTGQYCEEYCDCGVRSRDCYFDYFGNKQCSCFPGSAPFNGTCENCDCGLAPCELDEYGYKKECNCTNHQALFEGKCIACDCGDATCELDSNGHKRECNCTDNQIKYKGKCVDCDCGNSTCRLDYMGKKKCSCRNDQAFHKEKCIDCNCGEKSNGCYFDIFDNKWCVCLRGNAQFQGICQACDCGGRARGCSFDKNGGSINCNCQVGYTQRNNTCHENCKRTTDCLNGGACRTEKDGRFCKCRRGYSGDRCRTDDLCDKMKDKCDRMDATCIRDGDLALCACPQGKTYRWTSGKCESICNGKKCNFGTCEVVGKADYKCRCKQGFTGLHCDEIDNSSDTKFRVIVLAILCVTIVGFFIATLCLIRSNRKLIRSLQQNKSIQ